MRTFRSSRALPAIFATAVLAATLTIPAAGQKGPESILPPGFGDPNPAPTAAPARPRARSTPVA
ncbi:MAG: hypothetical protein EOP67_48295, partial [Sphingomonas sp.]